VSFAIRAPHQDEAAEIAELLNEHADAAFGEREIAEAEVRHWFTLPEIWIRVAERDGRLVGYVDAVRRGRDEAMELDVRTLEREIAEALLQAAEQHAQNGLLRVVAQGDDRVLPDLLRDGWRPVRRSYRMRIDLGDDVPEPRWPDGISARPLQLGEERKIYDANSIAFAEDWHFRPWPFEQWRDDNFRENLDYSLSWVAEAGDELAGFSLNSWHFSGDPEYGWIGILGVLPEWRRRGIATALLQQSFREFRSRGATRVGLGVDSENVTGAVRLYERAGMHVARLNVTHEKELS
jgi:mycothiol synthase